MDIVFYHHALQEMAEDGISVAEVREIIINPTAKGFGHSGRLIAWGAPNGRGIKVVYFVEDNVAYVVVTATRQKKPRGLK